MDQHPTPRIVVSRTPRVLFRPRLDVEPVPATCLLSNTRSLMTEWSWRKLSQEVAADAGWQCEVCEGRGTSHAVECHEMWLFDDARKAQRLMKLTALCPLCHRVKHYERSIETGHGDLVLGWLCRTNHWTLDHAQRYVAAFLEQFKSRSRYQWSLDLGALVGYDVTPDTLGLPGYLLGPHQREQIARERGLSAQGA